jgi:hypothetical protein
MKIVFTTLLFLAMTTPAYAAIPGTCAELEAAYKADLITSLEADCGGNANCEKLQAQQLRITAKEKGGFDDPSASDQDLRDQFEPVFTAVFIGNDVLEGVDVSLGDNPFVSFFIGGTTKLVSLTSDDGSISVGGKYCDVELGPYLSNVRKTNFCNQMVAQISSKYPKFDLGACLNAAEDTSFYVDAQSKGSAELSASRNLSDVGGGYFTCSAVLDRTNDAVTNVVCDVY